MMAKGKAMIGIAMAAIMVASVLVAMVPVGSAEAGIEGQKGLFLMLGYLTLGLSLSLAVLSLIYFAIRRRRAVTKKRSREEEIVETIKEIKELRKKLEERGINLTSLSDVFSVEVSILSEIRGVNRGVDDIKSWVLLELGLLVSFSLAIISMLFVITSML
ncbi:MAG: hypothetical protein IBX41_09235 [Methanophagales archaeon]|nr:hypothetical protein [Methanophagales archaeon]